MKKTVSLLLVCLLAASFVLTTGCGEATSTTSTTSDSQTTSGSGTTGEDEFQFGLSGSNTATGSNATASGETTSGTTSGTAGDSGNGGTANNQSGPVKAPENIGTEIGGVTDNKNTQGLTLVRFATINGGLFAGNNATSSTYADMFKKKAAEMRKSLKVNLKFMSIGVADENSLTTAMFAGNSSFDLLYYNGPQSRNWALNGLLLDQKSIKSIDFSQPQFNKAKGFTDGCTFYGKVYGSVFGSLLDNIPVVYANQTLINTYTNGKYDILQLYKDGQWTMEKYREIANAVKQVDAKGNPTVWGASYGLGNGLFIAAWAGGTVNRKVENGKEIYYPAMLSDAGVQCIEWLREMEHVEKSMMSGDNGLQGFKSGKVAMTNWNLDMASEIVPAVNGDVVVVPIPKAPTQKNHLFSARTNYYCIPKNVKDKELIGKVLMALSTVDMDAYYESLFLDTGLTEENLKIANKEFSAYANPEFIEGVDTTKFDALLLPAYNNSTGSVKQIFDSARGRFQAAIDDCYDRAEDFK